MEYSSAFVCLMGMGTVFFGLICIVALCYAMSAVCRRTERRKTVPAVPAASAVPAETGDRGELVAAVSAALAEELGTDISGIRILSLKKLDN